MLKSKNKLLTATIFTYVFMCAYSISVNMYGTIMPQLVSFYNISLVQASTLNIINDSSQTIIMVFMLFVADKLDKRKLLTFSAFCYGVTLFLVSTAASTYIILLMLRVCMGMFGGLVNNLTTTYISDLYGEDRTKYISILHTLFAIGSLLGPIFAAMSIETYSWQFSYLSLGIVIGLGAILFIVALKITGVPKVKAGLSEKNEKIVIPYKEMLKNKNLFALCIGNFLLSSVTFFMLWLPTYLTLNDSSLYTVEATTLIMTSTSVGMIISRILLGSFSPKIFSASFYLKWASLLTAILLAGVLLINTYTIWIVGIFIFGILSGATFTANVILACKEYPEFSATATAITGAFSMIGSMGLNAVVGALGDMGKHKIAMFIPVTLIFIAFFVYHFMYNEKEDI